MRNKVARLLRQQAADAKTEPVDRRLYYKKLKKYWRTLSHVQRGLLRLQAEA